MATQEYYRANSIEIENIKSVYDVANSHFKSDFFDLLSVTDHAELHYGEIKSKKYPSQFFNSSLKVSELTLTCFYKKEEHFFELIKHNFHSKIDSSFSISYCEKSSKQVRNYSDFVKVWLNNGRYFIQTFCGDNSKLKDDEEYRFATLGRYINELKLPITITGDATDYKLTHGHGGFLKTFSSSIFTSQPESFSVELVGYNGSQVIELLRDFVELASNSVLFSYDSKITVETSIGSSLTESDMMSKELSIYNTLADRYEVFYGFIVDSIEGLTVLQSSMTKKGRAEVGLFQIEYEGKRINCSVIVGKDELGLELESRYPIENIEKFNVILGVNFIAD